MVELADIEAAAKRLDSIAVKTPLLYSPQLDEIAGGRVYLKPECLQRTGSFKIRGAYNLLSRLDSVQAASGVVAWSSGNHAQGVAAAGSMLGIKTAIVMPQDAPSAKIDNTRRLGGEVILYDRYTGDRELIARTLAANRNATIVPSYDHAHIIAGQGTVGLEIMRQADELGVIPDQVLVCCGGGGLIAGSVIAIRSANASTLVHPVEPVDFDDTARSLKSGSRERNSPDARSICDALQSESPGEMTFAINRQRLNNGLTVTDDEVRQAMRFAFRHLKLVVEPGGAVALAAVLTGKIDTRDKVTVAVLSGGNVDAKLFAEIQSESPE
jgi:threonine dehydratase